MKSSAKVSEKGQVTIPKIVRDRLGIRPGQVLEFEAEEGRLVARKTMQGDPFTELAGTLDLGMSVDEAIELMRGKPDAI